MLTSVSTLWPSRIATTRSGTPARVSARRFSLIDAYRRGSIERERIYWDGVFKFRGGPNTPLRLLQESVRDVKPGGALDIAMGGGRNAPRRDTNDIAPFDAELVDQPAGKQEREGRRHLGDKSEIAEIFIGPAEIGGHVGLEDRDDRAVHRIEHPRDA